MRKDRVMEELDKIKFYCNDLDKEVTIKEYFIEILKRFWEEKEGFSGKRPFGNSGWDWDLFIPLIKAGLIKGELDEDGDIEDFDEKQANEIISNYIDTL